MPYRNVSHSCLTRCKSFSGNLRRSLNSLSTWIRNRTPLNLSKATTKKQSCLSAKLQVTCGNNSTPSKKHWQIQPELKKNPMLLAQKPRLRLQSLTKHWLSLALRMLISFKRHSDRSRCRKKCAKTWRHKSRSTNWMKKSFRQGITCWLS